MEQVPARLNKFYHTGFKYESSRQFCSKFVFDIYKEALCIPVGDIETFEELLHSNPDAKLAFWKFWFLGSIPWDRKTVTPASLWQHPNLELISACGIETPQREAEENDLAQPSRARLSRLSLICIAFWLTWQCVMAIASASAASACGLAGASATYEPYAVRLFPRYQYRRRFASPDAPRIQTRAVLVDRGDNRDAARLSQLEG